MKLSCVSLKTLFSKFLSALVNSKDVASSVAEKVEDIVSEISEISGDAYDKIKAFCEKIIAVCDELKASEKKDS